jgi:dTDP-4-amino-4,6-dideoxygalactose transaminase
MSMPVAIPFIDIKAANAEVSGEVRDAFERLYRDCAFIGGEAVERFEEEWADYCGTRYCVGVSDGTAAIELSLRALGIGRGDEVIVPANTFIATAAAVVAAGARPVFVDVDPATHLVTAADVRQAIGPRTAAVIAVHLYGQPADMDAIGAVAASAGIAVIEDAAQAHGATWRGRKAGSLSRAGCFSFYPGKNLGACGDAGAVVTDDAGLADRIRMLSNHGRPPAAAHLHHVVGTNGRLDGIQAAILSIKLTRLDAWNARRQRMAERYVQAFEGLPVEMVATAPGARSSHHLAVIRTEGRDELRRFLAAEGIGTGIHYPVPCHRQEAFADMAAPPLPVVERLAGRILSLPMCPYLTDAQVARVADAIHRATRQLELN